MWHNFLIGTWMNLQHWDVSAVQSKHSWEVGYGRMMATLLATWKWYITAPSPQALLNKLHKSRSFIIMHHHFYIYRFIMYSDSLHVFGLVFHVKHAWCPGLCLLLWLWGWLLWRSNQCGSQGWRLDVTHVQMKHIDRFGIVKPWHPWPIAGAHSLPLITIYAPTSQAELDSSLVWCQDKTSHPENRVPFLLAENELNAKSIKKTTVTYVLLLKS